jgi:hypothetical protein
MLYRSARRRLELALKRACEKQSTHGDEQDRKQKNKKHSQAFRSRIITKPINILRHPYSDNSNPQNDNGEHALNERNMVRATQRLSYFTAALVIVAILSFVASLLQWDAIRSSDKTTRESFALVQRAFITVKELKFTPHHGDNNKIVSWSYSPVIENSGSTPTKNLEFITASGLGSKGTIGEANEFAPDPDTMFERGYKIRSIIGPHAIGDFFNDRTKGIPLIAFEKIQDGGVFQVVLGSIHYKDIFDDEKIHITKYCFIILVLRDDAGVIIPRSIRCERWNCADEECDKRP